MNGTIAMSDDPEDRKRLQELVDATDLFTTTCLKTGELVIGKPVPGSKTEYEQLAEHVSGGCTIGGMSENVWRLWDGQIFIIRRQGRSFCGVKKPADSFKAAMARRSA